MPSHHVVQTQEWKLVADLRGGGLGQCIMNKVVESYTLLEKIGSGQYGNVYRATHRRSGE